ncbi:hypothetical protein [Streptomyces sp. NBC_00648]|uniref:hypothetical protein n=1 Tax=Streptomyces sp. NBC_00648 TaxID=2975797 RepID=UPI003249F6B5
MLPATERAVRAVQQALEANDFTTALATARAAYEAAADERERTELLLLLGPKAATD